MSAFSKGLNGDDLRVGLSERPDLSAVVQSRMDGSSFRRVACLAVSLVGRGNSQATTWVTCILAASAQGEPRRDCPVSPRCMPRALAVGYSFVTFLTNLCVGAGSQKRSQHWQSSNDVRRSRQAVIPAKRHIRPRPTTSRYRPDAPEKRKVDSSILSLTTYNL